MKRLARAVVAIGDGVDGVGDVVHRNEVERGAAFPRQRDGKCDRAGNQQHAEAVDAVEAVDLAGDRVSDDAGRPDDQDGQAILRLLDQDFGAVFRGLEAFRNDWPTASSFSMMTPIRFPRDVGARKMHEALEPFRGVCDRQDVLRAENVDRLGAPRVGRDRMNRGQVVDLGHLFGDPRKFFAGQPESILVMSPVMIVRRSEKVRSPVWLAIRSTSSLARVS